MNRVLFVLSLIMTGVVLCSPVQAALEGSADFNTDTFVDEADFAIWEANFGSVEASLAEGDADGNSIVDGDDFLLWQAQYVPGETPVSGGGGGGLSVTATPEPATWSLVAICLAGCLARRRRR